MSVDEGNYDEVINELEKKYEGTILRGDEIDDPEKIPTGSLELDYITGGGIPMGRWTRMYGGYSSTKTRTCWNVIREAQNLGMTVAYYNVEKQYHKSSVERAGIDTSQLTVVGGATVEEIGEKMEALLGVVNLHVIDSCSNAVSIDELEADIAAWRPGLMARAWGKALRRAHERFDVSENSVILVDQLRVNFGGRGKSSEEPPGGKFLGFISSMSLNFRRGAWLFYDKHGNLSEKPGKKDTMSGDMEPDGRVIKVRCEKSRVGRPELSATLYFDQNNYEFDHEHEYVNAMKFLGMVKNSGSWFTYDDNGTEIKKQGDAGLRELLAEKPELKPQIHEQVMATHSYIPKDPT